MGARWVTFDCFGTLVDWNTGFSAVLTPLFGPRTADVLRAYHEFERELEAERPHRLYKDVLANGLLRAAAKVGITLSESGARKLQHSWASLPVFGDVEEMLARLRAMGCRLAVLTNCDDDLFAQTQRNFREPFDLVITAERVGAYKPALAHFQCFAQSSGVALKDWVHVACSWFHDIAPASAFGVQPIWLDRDMGGEKEAVSFPHVRSASEVVPAAQKLYQQSA
jgi:2-haloacid dehalogenase